MKKTIITALAVIIGIGLTAGTGSEASAQKRKGKARTSATAKKKYDEVWKLKGNIGPYAITMTLGLSSHGFNGGMHSVTDYEGSYTYVDAGNTLRLNGSYDSYVSPDIILEEYTAKGRNSGTFNLEETENGLFGTFTNNSTGQTFDVTLRRTN